MAPAAPARLLREVRCDLRAARERDPAAVGVGTVELLLTWPGVQAVLVHRVAHRLWRAGVPVLPRLVAHLVRGLTGVEIHPGARLGCGVFIDHGAGVVIGETAEVGDDVTLFQGATLGGLGRRPGKRHPTVGDGALVGAGAKVLGPIDVGAGARVGANAVVLEDVPAGATAVGNPARVVRGVEAPPAGSGPDALQATVEAQRDRLEALERQVRALGGEPPADPDAASLATVRPLRDAAGG